MQLNLKSRRRHASRLSDRERDILSPLTVAGCVCVCVCVCERESVCECV